FSRSRPSRALHSFPTRRSSDLLVTAAHGHARSDPHLAAEALSHATSGGVVALLGPDAPVGRLLAEDRVDAAEVELGRWLEVFGRDRKSTRLNSSHVKISYAVFC